MVASAIFTSERPSFILRVTAVDVSILATVGVAPVPMTPPGLHSGAARHGRAGRTVIADQYWRIPLQALPPSYQDGDDEAYVYLLNPTGGVVQGDRLHTAMSSRSFEARLLLLRRRAAGALKLGFCFFEGLRFLLMADSFSS